jgi:hypothetical protein
MALNATRASMQALIGLTAIFKLEHSKWDATHDAHEPQPNAVMSKEKAAAARKDFSRCV